MNDIFEQMLLQHSVVGETDKRNAIYEVMQQVILGGLYRGGFFKEAAFYGGTCLRISPLCSVNGKTASRDATGTILNGTSGIASLLISTIYKSAQKISTALI